MDFVTTPEFDNEYNRLPQSEWEVVDEHLQQVLDHPAGRSARKGRLTDGTWICAFSSLAYSYKLYWDYNDRETLIFLLLLKS